MTSVYPLFFRRDDYIAGNGFICLVSSTGRVLLSVEEDSVWVYGVIPAAIAATGSTQEAALRDFKDTYITVLQDFAKEASDADAFERQVHAFFDQAADEIEQGWQAARETVRSEGITLEGVAAAREEEYPDGAQVIAIRDAVEVKPSSDPVFAYADYAAAA